MFLPDHLTGNGYFAIGEKRGLTIVQKEGLDFAKLDDFVATKNEWKFGFLTYDIKNNIEALNSNNSDELNFPLLYFFIPKTLLKYQQGKLELIYGDKAHWKEANRFLKSKPKNLVCNVDFKSKLTKQEYLERINSILKEIKLGNIYEANFCYEYFNKKAEINPFDLYQHLTALTNAPFASFGKFKDKYIISASPERFLKKEGNRLISEPIKGTTKRGKTHQEDLHLKEALRTNEKERSENIMIVDLVRNDLSRIANFNSVKVEELCKIHTFDTVHQMISKITCTINNNIRFSDIIKATYPMGSMTGAPKISAMQIIEREEKTKRGLYSGSVGYITPENDFDFNVIIRTFLYNSSKKYLSAMVGGAITAKSNANDEYKETLIKIEALLKALKK